MNTIKCKGKRFEGARGTFLKSSSSRQFSSAGLNLQSVPRGLFRSAAPFGPKTFFNPPQIVFILGCAYIFTFLFLEFLPISFDKFPLGRYSYKENKIRGFIHGALYFAAEGIHPAKLPSND